MLVSKSSKYNPLILNKTLLDLQPIDRLGNMDSPRLLVAHLPFDLLPDQVKTGKCKIVHVYRNPKAVFVSMFFHFRQVMEAAGRTGFTLQQLEGALFADQLTYRSMFYYFDKIKEFENLHPNVSIFHVSYEDMKEDTAGNIKRLAAHLQMEAPDELCSQIAEAVSFSKQKEEEEKQEEELGIGGITVYRKGEMSDWKNCLTVTQNERFDKVLSERTDSCRFSARYWP